MKSAVSFSWPSANHESSTTRRCKNQQLEAEETTTLSSYRRKDESSNSSIIVVRSIDIKQQQQQQQHETRTNEIMLTIRPPNKHMQAPDRETTSIRTTITNRKSINDDDGDHRKASKKGLITNRRRNKKCQCKMLATVATTILLITTTLLATSCLLSLATHQQQQTSANTSNASNVEPQMVELVRAKQAGNSIPAARLRRSTLDSLSLLADVSSAPSDSIGGRSAGGGLEVVSPGSPHQYQQYQQAQRQRNSASQVSRQQPHISSSQAANGELVAANNALQTEPQTAPGTTLSRPPTAIKNVTAQNGQSVLLHCLVEPSSDLVVSWFRGTGELQLLTYESNTIIQDERFVVRHGLVKDDDWALQIKSLDKTTDAGLYQCQTNSEPPQSQYYQLNIVEPQVNILGAPDMAVKLGAPINLTCVISQSPDQLQFIFWYRDERMINYDISLDRGKIVMAKLPGKQDTITSNLQIFNSKLSDSGNYTCMPSGARPQSIYVHVLEGLDKRLIMFQNDYDPSAASSQQTNSALSVHIIRFSRGRVYALFVAFIIFSSWLHLIAQVQTAISLLLLAIIGFFLGKVTGGSSNGAQFGNHRRSSSQSAYLDDLESEKKQEDERGDKFSKIQSGFGDQTMKKPPSKGRDGSGDDEFEGRDANDRRGGKQGWRLQRTSAARSSPNISSNSCGSTSSGDDGGNASESTNDTIDPLIKRANSAINQLKSLSSLVTDTTTSSDLDSSGGAERQNDARLRTQKQQTQKRTMRWKRTKQEQQQLMKMKRRQSAPKVAARDQPLEAKSELLLVKQASSNTSSEQKQQQPLTSPSASSASTGYNSDSGPAALHQHQRQHCRRHVVSNNNNSLLVEHKRETSCNISSNRDHVEVDEDDGQMIELLGQPTALNLIMDKFTGQRDQTAASLTATPSQASQLSHIIPVKPPRLEQLKLVERFVESLHSNPVQEKDQEEPHYSSPVVLQHQKLHFSAVAVAKTSIPPPQTPSVVDNVGGCLTAISSKWQQEYQASS